MLFDQLHSEFQNKYAVASYRHAVVSARLTLCQLCSLGLEWEIDGSKLLFDWSHRDEQGCIDAAASFFGAVPHTYVSTDLPLPLYTIQLIYTLLYNLFPAAIFPTGVDGFSTKPMTSRQVNLFGTETGYILIMPGDSNAAKRAEFCLDEMTLRVHLAVRRFTSSGTLDVGAKVWPEKLAQVSL